MTNSETIKKNITELMPAIKSVIEGSHKIKAERMPLEREGEYAVIFRGPNGLIDVSDEVLEQLETYINIATLLSGQKS